MSSLPAEHADVVIVGAGPAGLTAARYLRTSGVSSVLVLEREAEAGGIPRHSDHLGYGVRDLRTLLSGPAYARRLAERAEAAGADIRLSTTGPPARHRDRSPASGPRGGFRAAHHRGRRLRRRQPASSGRHR